ncbi:MAG: PDZ domain-containing protein [Candidatus Aminicenantes bacterium]|nr:MAG: PDZ domain-containing protein [Candidatus Aminicenantes bacterium]
MSTKLKMIFALTVFLLALFFSLKAEPTTASGSEKEIADITKRVFPSVVKVEARNRTRKVATGVIINKDGYIVTTALISPRDEEFFVTTSDGRRIEAEFLGMDSETHLALIRVKEKNLTPITMGKTDDLSPGSWIGVISISLENAPAVTQGIVSSIGQDSLGQESLRLNVWVVPGMSGSPVVDGKGHMVGLLRGIYSDTKPVVFEFREKEIVGSGYVFSRAEAPSSGMALAVPVHVVQNVSAQIKEKGKVERGWLGVRIIVNEDGEIEISNIEDESPAELAKLKRGDIILQIGGKDVSNRQMLRNEIRMRRPGESVTIKIERKGKTEEIKVRLGEYSEKDIFQEFERKFPRLFAPKLLEPLRPTVPVEPELFRWGFENRRYIGVYIQDLNEELSEHFGVKKGTGLLVSEISEDSPAEKAGLKVGDVIVKADGKRVETTNELVDLIQDKERGEKIKIVFLRDRKERSAEIEIEEEERRGSFFFPGDREVFFGSLDDYQEKFQNQYRKWQDEYSKKNKERIEKWNKQLKKHYDELNKKAKEAKKDFTIALNTHRGIRI